MSYVNPGYGAARGDGPQSMKKEAVPHKGCQPRHSALGNLVRKIINVYARDLL